MGIPCKRCQSDRATAKSNCSRLSTTRLSKGTIGVVIVDILATLQAVEHVPVNGKRCRQCGKCNYFARCCLSKTTVKWSIVLTAVNAKFITCSCHTEGVKIQFIVDLCANVSVIIQQTYQETFKDCLLAIKYPISVERINYSFIGTREIITKLC